MSILDERQLRLAEPFRQPAINGAHDDALVMTVDDDYDDEQTTDTRATELANAEEVFALYGQNIRYHLGVGKFFVWCGTHSKKDTNGQAERWIMYVAKATGERLKTQLKGKLDPKVIAKHVAHMESSRGVAGVAKLLQKFTGVSVEANAFDANDYLLNCINGTVNLRTGTLQAHRREDLITHCLATPYDPSAICPLWESFLHRSMGGRQALINYLQKMVGIALTGSADVHELYILFGAGANGKSVFCDTVLGILESYGSVAPESLMTTRNGFGEHPTELADLLGKRLAIGSETEAGITLRLQTIKRLTGDAVIKGRFMRQDFFEIRRTWKLWLVTNNRPRLSENTEAVWRRLRLIPWDFVVPAPERDPHLIEKLRAERSGILAWAVRGCLAWQREGMTPPDEVLVATEAYREEADELAEFIQTRCMVGDRDTFRASRTELFASYNAWAKLSNERHPMERAVFYEALRRREGIDDSQWKVDGQKVRGFAGIGLASFTEEGGR